MDIAMENKCIVLTCKTQKASILFKYLQQAQMCHVHCTSNH